MTLTARRTAMLASIGTALVVLVAVGLAALSWRGLDLDRGGRVVAFMVSLCLAGLLWLLAVWIVRQGRLLPRAIWIVLAAAAAGGPAAQPGRQAAKAGRPGRCSP